MSRPLDRTGKIRRAPGPVPLTPGPPPTWSSEFDAWLDQALRDGDIDGLIDFRVKVPAADLAHPATEHFAPLFVVLGAAIDDFGHIDTAIDGFWYGLSKRSVQIAWTTNSR